jgi:hypothetical protein
MERENFILIGNNNDTILVLKLDIFYDETDKMQKVYIFI